MEKKEKERDKKVWGTGEFNKNKKGKPNRIVRSTVQNERKHRPFEPPVMFTHIRLRE